MDSAMRGASRGLRLKSCEPPEVPANLKAALHAQPRRDSFREEVRGWARSEDPAAELENDYSDQQSPHAEARRATCETIEEVLRSPADDGYHRG